MSMPFVMPISLVVTFLLQTDNFRISPGSPEDHNEASHRDWKAGMLSLPDRCKDVWAVQPGSTQGLL